MGNEKKTEHTPTPWKLFHEGETLSVYHAKMDDVVHWSGFDAAGPEGRVTPRHVANAALIVRAVNAHDDLVKALTALRDAVADNPEMQGRAYVGLGIQVNAALAKAQAPS